MKTSGSPVRNRQILEEAAAWFVDCRVGDIDAQARAKFDRWLRRSPEHIQAYLEIAGTYAELPPTQDGQIDVAQIVAAARADSKVIALEQTSRAGRALDLPPRAWGRRRPLLAASFAAACVAAGMLAWLLLPYAPTYSTGIGEQRSISLADGSTVEMNARTRIRLRFSESVRGVDLLEGQALFAVAKDKARPFLVRSGATVVQAVGTSFDVHRKESGTTVTVLEGRVAVLRERSSSIEALTYIGPDDGSSPSEEPGEQAQRPARREMPVLVSAGEQVTVTQQLVAQPRQADTAAATAWTQRRLVFEGSPLKEVAEEFNRFNQRQIVVDDASLRDFHVSGVYSSTDPASFLRFLRAQPGVEVRETPQRIYVSQKAQ